MMKFIFVFITVALCSQQIAHGSPVAVNDLAKAIQALTMSNNEWESQAQESIMKIIAEELSNEQKQKKSFEIENQRRAKIAQNPPLVDIEDCGPVGDLIEGILQATLNPWFTQGTASILVDCGLTKDCTKVRVDVPVGTTQADVDVCYNKSK